MNGKLGWAVTVVALMVTGCGLPESDGLNIAPGSFRVVLPLSSGEVGARTRPSAVGALDDGSPIGLSAVADWSSSDEQVAAFIEPGLLQFKKTGVARITASYQGQSASADVTVAEARIVTLKLDGPERMNTGERGTFTLTGTRTNGEEVDLTSLATWRFTDGLEQLGAQTNECIARANFGVVKATFDGRSVERTIFISEAATMTLNIWMPGTIESGTSLPLTLMQQRAGGELVDATRDAQWATSDERIAYITNDASGVVLHALVPGSVSVTARTGGLDTSAMLLVDPLRVQKLTFAQPVLEVREREVRPVDVFALRVDGSTIRLPEGATWLSSDPSIVLCEEGRIIGLSRGTATVTVNYEGVTASAAVVVHPQPVISLAVSHREVRIERGTTFDITVFGMHVDGSSEVMSDEVQVEVVGKVTVERNGGVFTIVGLEIGAGQVIFRARDRMAVVDVAVSGR